MSHDYLERILKARVYDVAIETPLEEAPRLSRRLGNAVLFKREDLQPVFSFKVRGAYNKIAHLVRDHCAEARRDLRVGRQSCTGRRAGRQAPRHPGDDRDAADDAAHQGAGGARLGGEAVLHGDDYDQAYDHATDAHARAAARVHPSVRRSRRDRRPGHDRHGNPAAAIGRNIDAIFVAVGGGGLIAGVAAYVKYLFPKIRIIGVEPEDADAMSRSLQAGKRVTLDRVGIFADGVAVRRVGEEPFRLAREYVDEVLTVEHGRDLRGDPGYLRGQPHDRRTRGGVAVAGVKRYVAREQCRERSFVAINCGANMNFDRLRHVAERADIGGQREALVAVEIPEQKGSFLRFCETLGRRSVTEFNYRYNDGAAAQLSSAWRCRGPQREGDRHSVAPRGRLSGRRHDRQ